jgi:predicted transcriptional regulator
MTHHPSKEQQTTCLCAGLNDTIVVDMGDESDKVFASLSEVKKRGQPYWWLSVYQCYVCQQSWLVGQEERQNDVMCLQKLDLATMQNVLNNSQWPATFDHYKDLLRLGLQAGKQVWFLDPLNSSLRWTISDLAKENPGINVSEIAKLLNLKIDLAVELANKATREDGVQITFDVSE